MASTVIFPSKKFFAKLAFKRFFIRVDDFMLFHMGITRKHFIAELEKTIIFNTSILINSKSFLVFSNQN